MTIASGAKLGSYEIVPALGAGGMGDSVQREPRSRRERDRAKLLFGPVELLQEAGVLLQADGPRPILLESLAHLGRGVEGDVEVQRLRARP